MFSPHVPVYHLLHLAHRHSALSLPEIAHCRCRVLRIRPHPELLEDIGDILWTPYTCRRP